MHAFVRATSSGALNNIGHLRKRLKVHFADLTDRTSIDYLVRELREAPDKPYVFHLGAQAHVGESWPGRETVMANTVGTLNLLQSVVDWGWSWRSSTRPDIGGVATCVKRSPTITTSMTRGR